jgi:transposase-like protein
MVTVEVDAVCVERRLNRGELNCPRCGGVLAGWGFGRSRRLRGPDGGVKEIRPRRSRCSSCGCTHMLLPVGALLRRSDTVEVVGAAVEAAASGQGHRPIARRLGRPPETVRGWLRRFRARAERLRLAFTTLLVALAADPAVLPTPAESPLADALAALVAVAVAMGDRFGRANPSGPNPARASLVTTLPV